VRECSTKPCTDRYESQNNGEGGTCWSCKAFYYKECNQ
jgi:hypothetical protein